jgi:dTDP-glucose 4,6-dehydratase
VQKICDQAKVKFEDVVEIAPDRLGKDQAYLLDSGKIKNELGWEPQVDLDAGLERCARWSLEYLELLKRLPQDYQHKP